MKLVFLVGPHKTGSTYLQVNLAKQRKALRDSGWIYPEAGSNGDFGHHHLAHDFAAHLGAESPGAKALRAVAQSARETDENVVFAAEGFCRWHTRKFDAVAELFGETDYEVVYVLRDPIWLIHSYWSEEVKQGRTMSFSDKFASAFADPRRDRLLNAIMDLSPLIRQSNVTLRVVPYDTLMRRGEDIFSHIAETVLGIRDAKPVVRREINPSLPIEITELLRLASLVHGSNALNIGSGLRLAFLKGTSQEELDALCDLVRSNGASARREITVPADNLFLRRQEQILRQRLEGLWSCQPDHEGLFSRHSRTLVHYDTYHLWCSDAVRAQAEDIARRFGPIEEADTESLQG